MKKSILSIILLFCIFQFIFIYVHAEQVNEIAVTSILTESTYTTIVINNCIRISKIQLLCDIDGNNCINFPEYINSNKKPIAFVVLLNDRIESIIYNALSDKTTIEKDIENATFRISAVNKNPDIDSNIKAFITLVFNEGIAVEVRIVQTNDKLWVMWPTIEDTQTHKMTQVVEIIKGTMRKMVEKMLIQKYTLTSKAWK